MNSIYFYFERISPNECLLSLTKYNKNEVKISAFTSMKEDKKIPTEWVNLKITYLSKASDFELIKRRIYIKHDDITQLLKIFELNIDDFEKSKQFNSIERFLNHGIVTKQRKAHVYADQDLGEIGMTRPEFKTFKKKFNKFDFVQIPIAEKSETQEKKIYYFPDLKKLEANKSENKEKQRYYTVRQLPMSDIYLRTYCQKTEGSSKQVFAELNLTQKRLEIRTKIRWKYIPFSTSEPQDLESEILSKMKNKEGIVQFINIIEKNLNKKELDKKVPDQKKPEKTDLDNTELDIEDPNKQDPNKQEPDKTALDKKDPDHKKPEKSDLDKEELHKLELHKDVFDQKDLDKDAVEFNTRQYFLEYCDAGTLNSAYPFMTTEEKFGVLRDVFYGLEHLHAEGYVHFDLHMSNLLLKKTENGGLRGKISDFNISKKIDSMTTTKGLMVQTVENSAWNANQTAFSPEMLIHLYQRRLMHLKAQINRVQEAFVTKDQKNLQKIYKEVMENNPKKINPNSKSAIFPITGKQDIWQLGLNLAFLYYGIEKEKKTESVEIIQKIKKLFQKKEFIQKKEFPSFLNYLVPLINKKLKYNEIPLNELKNIIYELWDPTNAPSDQCSMDYLIWSMLQPDPDKRPSAQECIKFIDENFLKTKNSTKEEMTDN